MPAKFHCDGCDKIVDPNKHVIRFYVDKLESDWIVSIGRTVSGNSIVHTVCSLDCVQRILNQSEAGRSCLS